MNAKTSQKGKSKKTKVLVTGAGGQLGYLATWLLESVGYEVIGLTSNQLDITDRSAIDKAVWWFRPDFIVNCAAYTAVDKAEEDSAKAYAVNAEGVKYLAEAANKFSAKLIHISTDYVFDGKKGRPYVETDQPNPLSAYGKSKLKGEQYALEIAETAIILRVSLLYRVGREGNFVELMKKLVRKGIDLDVVMDQISNPTNARDLAYAIGYIIPMIKTGTKEIYHFANGGSVSRYDLVIAIRDILGGKNKITPVTTEAYNAANYQGKTIADRGKNTSFDTSKFERTFGFPTSGWRDSLERDIEDPKELEEKQAA